MSGVAITVEVHEAFDLLREVGLTDDVGARSLVAFALGEDGDPGVLPVLGQHHAPRTIWSACLGSTPVDGHVDV